MKQVRRKLEKINDVWNVNGSSLELFQTCPKKFHYVMGLEESPQSEATVFGSAIHTALAEFYKNKPGNRSLPKMIEAFRESCYESNIIVPFEIKGSGSGRSLENGDKIITSFYDIWKDDKLVALEDENGLFIEREFQVEVVPGKINLFGTIDLVCKHEESGQIVLMDHKTTRSILNMQDRVKPNHQLTAYWYALNKMGIKVDMAMFQGIQVAKTKHQSVRVATHRDNGDFREWELWVTDTVSRLDVALNLGLFTMNGGYACHQYGACSFLTVCQAPAEMRANLMKKAPQMVVEE